MSEGQVSAITKVTRAKLDLVKITENVKIDEISKEFWYFIKRKALFPDLQSQLEGQDKILKDFVIISPQAPKSIMLGNAL